MSARVLVIEDDRSLRVLVVDYLRHCGFECRGVGFANAASGDQNPSLVDVVIHAERLPVGHGPADARVSAPLDVMMIRDGRGPQNRQSALGRGDADFLVKPICLEELLLRLERFLERQHQRREKRRKLSELKQLAVSDELTGLFNDRHFHRRLALEIERALGRQRLLALLFMDIDRFKRFNDRHGHMQGNRVLAAVGRTLSSRLRAADTACRFGGEEFAVLLPDTGLPAAGVVAERLRAGVAGLRLPDSSGDDAAIAVSIGVTNCFADDTAETLADRADQAMYQAKSRGGDCVVLIDAGV